MAAHTESSGCPKGFGHLPNESSSTLHPFIPPSSSDLRSPCPGLNALANHGYINRDGRNLTINSLVGATQHVYRLTKPLAYLLAITGVFLCGDGRTVDLHRLAKHGVIEHDASLSRQDTEPPNKYAPTTVDPELVDELMHTSPNDFLVLNDLAAARVSRESQARGGPLDFIHAEIGSAESALILQVFGDEKLEVEKDVLRDWFIDGRLPDSWKCPERMIGLLTSMSVTKRVKNAMASIRNPKSA